jgi:hypothetical protein
MHVRVRDRPRPVVVSRIGHLRRDNVHDLQAAIVIQMHVPEMAQRLEKALSDAGVDRRCEIYPGALHGWTMADFPVYDEPAAERH